MTTPTTIAFAASAGIVGLIALLTLRKHGHKQRLYTAAAGDQGWAIANRFGLPTKPFYAYEHNAAGGSKVTPGMTFLIAPGWVDKGARQFAQGSVS